MLWLSLHFYNLPLEVFSLENETLARKQSEFAVVESNRLVFCNQQALKKGLEVNMKVATAYALCDQLKIKQRCNQLESNKLNQLALLAYSFSSQVCIYNQTSILLEIGRSRKLFNDVFHLLKALFSQIESVSVDCYVAISSTPKAAYLLSVSMKILMKNYLFADHQYMNLQVNNEVFGQLKNTSIKALESEPNYISLNIVKKIKKMGFCSLGEILSLPEAAIGRRFGQEFLSYIHCLTGKQKEILSLFSVPENFLIKRCFVNGLDTIEQILFPARRMLDSFVLFLRNKREMANKITWRLLCFNGEEFFFNILLSSETQDLKPLMELTRLKLQNFVLKEKVETISLESDSFSLLSEKQKKLGLEVYAGEASDVERCNIKSLLDRLSVRLEDGCFFSMSNGCEHLPEKKSIKTNVGQVEQKSLEGLDDEIKQPLWLVGKQKITVQHKGNNCRELSYKGRIAIVTIQERIEGQWWEGCQRRDYYIAKNERGNHYWIYQDLNSGGWFLQGVF